MGATRYYQEQLERQQGLLPSQLLDKVNTPTTAGALPAPTGTPGAPMPFGARGAGGLPPATTATVPWNPQTESVSARLTGLLQEDSPLMQAAKTTGLKMANRRGLLNTSMAVGAAQGEMLKAAVPIASQEAAQAATRELSAQEAAQTGVLQARQFGRDYEIQARDIEAQMDRLVPQLAQREQEVLANIASNDREKATAGIRDMTQIYNESWMAILANPDLDEASRSAYLVHIAELRETDLFMIEQLYGIDLEWATPEMPG